MSTVDRRAFQRDDRPMSLWAVRLIFGSDLHHSAEDPFGVLRICADAAWNFDSHIFKLINDFSAAASQSIKETDARSGQECVCPEGVACIVAVVESAMLFSPILF